MGDRYNSERHVALGGAWQRAGMRLMRQFEIPARTRILDAGCGNGELTQQLARCAPEGETLGIDSNASAIAQACHLAADAGLAHLRFEVADFLAWTPATPFDAVFCNSTLHLTRPDAAGASRLAGFLAPGGVLALQLPARDLSEEVRDALQSALAAVGVDNPFPVWNAAWHLPTSSELAAAVQETGLRDIRAMEEFEPLTFRSPEDAAAYFTGLLLDPYLRQIPDERHADFLEAFGASFPLANGLPHCLLKRLYLIARRAGG